YYMTLAGAVKGADGVTFTVNQGERFGMVGESGCGKSTTVMSVLRLVPPPGRIVGGQIMLAGREGDGRRGDGWEDDLVALSENEMRDVRWSRISLIPQGAMNSLNPVMRIRDQMADTIITHEGMEARSGLDDRIGDLLSSVGLTPEVMRVYPHQLSGGMKQRVCVAMAISLNPQLIIADEPTSALDVVVQRLVMQTIIEMQERIGAAVILIGHDMGLQAQFVQRLCVMYAGRVAEVGDVRAMFKDPLHPYTQLLIAAIPSIREKKPPASIPGLPPALLNPPPGCLFHPRCPRAMDVCNRAVPDLQEVKPGHIVACHLYK
ncbi:MAG: ABC transporter ATP-binding protein, partial [Anaerolineae bacterium]|nr:ABC transporter ATP-binding protein [Anaerolineae bacterium]